MESWEIAMMDGEKYLEKCILRNQKLNVWRLNSRKMLLKGKFANKSIKAGYQALTNTS